MINRKIHSLFKIDEMKIEKEKNLKLIEELKEQLQKAKQENLQGENNDTGTVHESDLMLE